MLNPSKKTSPVDTLLTFTVPPISRRDVISNQYALYSKIYNKYIYSILYAEHNCDKFKRKRATLWERVCVPATASV